jgi:hypothetical protein
VDSDNHFTVYSHSNRESEKVGFKLDLNAPSFVGIKLTDDSNSNSQKLTFLPALVLAQI